MDSELKFYKLKEFIDEHKSKVIELCPEGVDGTGSNYARGYIDCIKYISQTAELISEEKLNA